jgi:GTP-binding protein Era
MTKENAKNKGEEGASFRSGYIAIVGRPNVGKSTLLNQLLGEKVAIVTPKPQTTRNRITGIRTSEQSQIVFIDTPGIHQAHSLMNRRMVEIALQTLHEVDGVLWLLDSRERIGPEEEKIAGNLSKLKTPGLILLNKIDLVSKSKLLPLMQRCAELLAGREIIPISALKGDGVPAVLEAVERWLPEGPQYFPGGEFTDQTERFVASEIIREKIFLLTHEEIPYGVAVIIDEFTEKEEKKPDCDQGHDHHRARITQADLNRQARVNAEGSRPARPRRAGSAARLQDLFGTFRQGGSGLDSGPAGANRDGVVRWFRHQP